MKSVVTISGTTSSGNDFDYNVSLDRTKKNYLPNVFGVKSQDKETELFVEELFINSLDDLNTAGKVRGLDITFLNISGDSTNNLSNYEE